MEDLDAKSLVLLLYKMNIETNSMARQIILNQAEIFRMMLEMHNHLKIDLGETINKKMISIEDMWSELAQRRACMDEVSIKSRLMRWVENSPIQFEGSLTDYITKKPKTT